jgi:hypothetical protein
MKTAYYAILVSLVMTGCQFSRSVKKDLVSGLTSAGNGLTCEEVYLTVDKKRTSSPSFNYGELVYLIFRDIKGFKQENGNSFPFMQILVTGMSGDTLLLVDDLYSEYKDGMNYSPLQLTATLTVATPIKSGGEYLLTVVIKDRKGPGTYISKLKFTVSGTDKINAEPLNVSYNEIYLYSQGKGKVINDARINFDDDIYIIVEGLKGFKEENGKVFPGLSLTGTDSKGNAILDYPDMFSDYDASGMEASDLAARVSPSFKLTGTEFDNPLHIELIISDKKSNARLKINTNLTVE